MHHTKISQMFLKDILKEINLIEIREIFSTTIKQS